MLAKSEGSVHHNACEVSIFLAITASSVAVCHMIQGISSPMACISIRLSGMKTTIFCEPVPSAAGKLGRRISM